MFFTFTLLLTYHFYKTSNFQKVLLPHQRPWALMRATERVVSRVRQSPPVHHGNLQRAPRHVLLGQPQISQDAALQLELWQVENLSAALVGNFGRFWGGSLLPWVLEGGDRQVFQFRGSRRMDLRWFFSHTDRISHPCRRQHVRLNIMIILNFTASFCQAYTFKSNSILVIFVFFFNSTFTIYRLFFQYFLLKQFWSHQLKQFIYVCLSFYLLNLIISLGLKQINAKFSKFF